MNGSPVRTLVVSCPDWPVTAAGHGLDEPVAVVFANRVVACSAAARDEGVECGLRRRQAESRCPGLVVIAHDPDGDARAFEAVLAVVESFTPRVEVLRPGTCAFATRGPSRYFGGDGSLAAKVMDGVDAVLAAGGAAAPRCQVGIADGRFAAELAAGAGVVVPPGESAAFLAPLPVAALPEMPDLADLFVRLGVRTLGELAALPAKAVLGRFGDEGATAHRLATGRDDRPLAARVPPPDLDVAAELDPPVDNAEAVAFVAKSLADRLDDSLAGRGLVATRVGIELETEHGEGMSRLWRHDGGLTATALAQRARWQIDGWLSGPRPPTAGFTLLRLVPDEVGPATGRQAGFWGGDRSGDDRAARAMARVQAMLGPESVRIAVSDGGREPGDAVRLVPWGDAPGASGRETAPAYGRETAPAYGRETAPAYGRETAPWPGRIPPPSPATVQTLPADVVDEAGAPVAVNGRGSAATAPTRLSIDGAAWQGIVAWAGPWPVDERWWDPCAHRRRARWQVVTAGGTAYLLVLERSRWSVEAVYD
jgi:protein ImuB